MVLASCGSDPLYPELHRGESLCEFDRDAVLFGAADPVWGNLGESARTVWLLVGMAEMARRQGAYERSRNLCEEAKALAEAIGFAPGVARALRALADVDLARGEHRRAAIGHAACLSLARAAGDAAATSRGLARLAAVGSFA